VSSLVQAGYSVRGLANWILDFSEEHGFSQTNMAINKLVFFAYEALLLKKRKVLTKAKIEAWDHGPVFREVYHDFKRFGDRPIKDRATFFSVATGKVELSRVELAADDATEMAYALLPLISLSASQLRELSHAKGGAWDRVWRYEGYANPGMEITPEIMLEAAQEGANR